MRRRRITILVVAVAFAVVAAFWPRSPREPIYQGKRLTYWILEACNEGERRETGRRVIHAIGTNALPWLISEFTRPPLPTWRTSFNRWSSRHLKFRFQEERERMLEVAAGFRLLGPDAAPMFPLLASYLGDSRRGGYVIHSMQGAADMALPYLNAAIVSTNAAAARMAWHGLDYLVRESDAGVPALIQLLGHTNAAVRRRAFTSLSEAMPDVPLRIPALAAALSDPDVQVRVSGTQLLAELRWNSAPLVAKLRWQIQSTNPAVVLTASNALHLLPASNVAPSP